MTNFSTPAKAVFAVFSLSLVVWAVVFYGKVLAITDVFLHTYSSQNANLIEISKGKVPLWDPYIGCGTPQLASGLGACFYPFYWLWNLTGLSHWMVWMSLLHSAFAFFGFYLWARTQKIFPLWAALGALSFAGSLHMVRLWGYPIFLSSQAWTPWIFWAASRFLEEGKTRWWLALALAAGFQVLAGYPFFSFYAVVFVASWIFFQPSESGRKGKASLALGVAFAWTTAHWLPFLDFLRYAARDNWTSPENFPYFSKAVEYLTLLSPTALGMPETAAYGGQTANANFMMYFGLIPLFAFVLGGAFQKFPGRNFWGLAAFFWLIWLMGFRFPLWKVLPAPLLESLNPSKAVGVFLFAACTCAGLALTRFFRDRWDERKRLAVCWIVCVLWMLDVLSIPARILHPIPDPFLKPAIKQWAAEVKAETGSGRLLSLQAKDRTISYGGDASLFETSADGWVRGLLANSQQIWEIRSAQAYLSLWTGSMEKLWRAFNKKETYNGRLPDVAGVRTLYFPIELPAPRYRTLKKMGGGYLIWNTDCVEDAWLARAGRILRNQDDILVELSRPKKAGESHDAFLEEVFLPAPSRSLAIPAERMEAGLRRISASSASFTGELSGTKWLVWNETFAPGWKAWVDGKPAPIHRANGFFMAVPTGSDGTRIDLRYEPVAWRLGFFISLVFFILFFAFLGLRGSFRDPRQGGILTDSRG